MAETCCHFPKFTIEDGFGHHAEYWRDGRKYYKQACDPMGWPLPPKEITAAHFAIALLNAHEATPQPEPA